MLNCIPRMSLGSPGLAEPGDLDEPALLNGTSRGGSGGRRVGLKKGAPHPGYKEELPKGFGSTVYSTRKTTAPHGRRSRD